MEKTLLALITLTAIAVPARQQCRYLARRRTALRSSTSLAPYRPKKEGWRERSGTVVIDSGSAATTLEACSRHALRSSRIASSISRKSFTPYGALATATDNNALRASALEVEVDALRSRISFRLGGRRPAQGRYPRRGGHGLQPVCQRCAAVCARLLPQAARERRGG